MNDARGLEYDPWAHAEQLGVTVHHRALGGRRSILLADHPAIYLDEHLDAIEARCVLAFQLGHHVLNHRVVDDRTTWAAKKWAIERLITPEALRQAARRPVHEWVRILGVTPDALHFYMEHEAEAA